MENMRKIMKMIGVVTIVIMLLSLSYNSVAQTVDERNRTAVTLVADVLDQLPAQDINEYNTLMSELLSNTMENVRELIALWSPSNNGANDKIEYALYGMSDFVTSPEGMTFRDDLFSTLIQLFESSDDDEIRMILVNMIGKFANAKEMSLIMKYAENEALEDAVMRAVISVSGTEAMIRSAMREDKINRKLLAYAAGYKRIPKTESILISWLEGADDNLKSNVYYALSEVGTATSVPVLAQAAAETDYSLESTNATAYYLRLLYNIASNSMGEVMKDIKNSTVNDTVLIDNELKKLFKVKKVNVKTSAMEIMAAMHGEDAVEPLVKMVKNKDPQVRNTALRLLKPYATPAVRTAVVVKAKKTVVKVDVLNWLASLHDSTQKEFINKQLKSKKPDVAEAAILAVGASEEPEELVSLVSVIGKNHDDLLKSVLCSYKFNVYFVLDSALNCGVQQQLFALDVLSDRSCPGVYGKVNAMLESDNAEIKDAAYKALAGVTSPTNINTLKDMLISVDERYVPDVQNALIKALSFLDGIRVDDFMSSIKKLGDDKKPRFFKVWASLDNDKALTNLVDSYNKGINPDKALEALLTVDNYSIAPMLLDIAKRNRTMSDTIYDRYVTLVRNADISDVERMSCYRNLLALNPSYYIKNKVMNAISETDSYAGLMMVADYVNDVNTVQSAANAVLAIACRNPQYNGSEIIQLLERIKNVFNDEDAAYKKTQIDEHIKKIAKVPAYQLSESEQKEGFVILFDGTNLDQWIGDKTNYVVRDGNIYVSANYGNDGNLYTVKEYDNFVLRFEFCFTRPGVNNGVGIRTPMNVDAAYEGMEIQILDHDAPIYKGLHDYQVHGSVYGVIPAKRYVFPELGTWITEEIVADGDNIKVTVNGEVILDGNIRKACNGRNMGPEGMKGNPNTVDGNNHPGLFNKKGHISFCGHGEGLLLRNIRIKEL